MWSSELVILPILTMSTSLLQVVVPSLRSRNGSSYSSFSCHSQFLSSSWTSSLVRSERSHSHNWGSNRQGDCNYNFNIRACPSFRWYNWILFSRRQTRRRRAESSLPVMHTSTSYSFSSESSPIVSTVLSGTNFNYDLCKEDCLVHLGVDKEHLYSQNHFYHIPSNIIYVQYETLLFLSSS